MSGHGADRVRMEDGEHSGIGGCTDVVLPDTDLVIRAALLQGGALADLRRPIFLEPLSTVVTDFEHAVELWPTSDAITSQGERMSYKDCDRASRWLAGLLRERVPCHSPAIAIYGRAAAACLVACFGVLRAGSRLLLIDARLPLERCQTIIRDCGATGVIVIGDDDALRAAKSLPAPLIVHLGGSCMDWELSETFVEIESCRPSPTDAAYIVFTSGSTGRPKGIEGNHGSLRHLVHWQRTRFGIGPGDRIGQVTGLSSDVILREAFMALTSGACLYIPPAGTTLEGARLFAWLETEQVTALHAVPSLARFWLKPGTVLAEVQARVPVLGPSPLYFFCRKFAYDVAGARLETSVPSTSSRHQLLRPHRDHPC